MQIALFVLSFVNLKKMIKLELLKISFTNGETQLHVNDILVVKLKDCNGDIIINKKTNPWQQNNWILRKNFYKIEILDVILLFIRCKTFLYTVIALTEFLDVYFRHACRIIFLSFVFFFGSLDLKKKYWIDLHKIKTHFKFF